MHPEDLKPGDTFVQDGVTYEAIDRPWVIVNDGPAEYGAWHVMCRRVTPEVVDFQRPQVEIQA